MAGGTKLPGAPNLPIEVHRTMLISAPYSSSLGVPLEEDGQQLQATWRIDELLQRTILQ